MKDWVPFAQLIAPIIFLASALIAYGALQNNRRTNRYLKSIDVVLKFNEWYNALAHEQRALSRRGSTITNEEAKDYYRRYWNLQEDQFTMLKLGVIEPGIYTDWMINIARLFDENPSTGTIPFRAGWLEIGKIENLESADFVRFFDEILRISNPRGLKQPQGDAIKVLVEGLLKSSRERRDRWFNEFDGGLSFKWPVFRSRRT